VAEEFYGKHAANRVYDNLLTNPLYLSPGQEEKMVFRVSSGTLKELQTNVSVSDFPMAEAVYDVMRNSDGEE
uniref:hypothetical protein n=1 Tax=Klebsiella pneumoniae TaxID=573 RepID=UPI0025A013BE